MKKDDLLKQIAEKGYDVGFGAKKHFASYDIICRVPRIISFVTLGIGVYAIFVDQLSTQCVSATLIVLGIVGLLVYQSIDRAEEYEHAGKKLTGLWNDLKKLYYIVKKKDTDFSKEITLLAGIEEEYYQISISKQMEFSDWYAHYKFFWQHQIGWIEEEIDFKFWRDKVPLTLTLSLIVFVLFCITRFLIELLKQGAI